MSGHIVLSKAAYFAQRFEIPDFKGSHGWFDRFKKRYNVQEYVRSGEANSAPLRDLDQHRSDLQDLLRTWNLEDVYNCDETALYWKLEPSRTLARHRIAGTKKPKDRITLLLACNATGTVKLTPVFIHKYKNPRCMRQIDQRSLPVYYYWNSSAWMQLSIFSRWLSQLNSDLRRKQQKILLLLDNATVHSLEESYSNITLHYLPKNTTAHLQPCDAGIIYSFKASNVFYNVLFMTNILANILTCFNSRSIANFYVKTALKHMMHTLTRKFLYPNLQYSMQFISRQMLGS